MPSKGSIVGAFRRSRSDPMKFKTIICHVPLMLLAVSCEKEVVTPETLTPPNSQVVEVCGTPGARLQANFDGASWCPTVNLYATAAATGQIGINGITLMGSTLTLLLDSVAPGTYQMVETANAMIFTTSTSITYIAREIDPVTLVISEHDVVNRRIKGTFQGHVHTALLEPKAIEGSFDVEYVVEE